MSTNKRSSSPTSTNFVSSEEPNFEADIGRVIVKELRYIKRQRAGNGIRQNTIGLALSGGGIRSATFSLGVIQELARSKWLENIDYLSTVSGGGYIGSSLTWLFHKDWEMGQNRFGVTDEKFPYHANFGGLAAQGSADIENNTFETDTPELKKIELLRTLRQNGNYLTPGAGLNILSVVAVLLRGILLSLFVYLPLVTLFMLGLYASYFIRPFSEYADWWSYYTSLTLWGSEIPLNGALIVYLILVGGSFLSMLVFAISTYTQSAAKRKTRYSDRRAYEIKTAKILVAGALLIVIGTLPVVHQVILEYSATFGLLSTVLGFSASLAAFIKTRGSEKEKNRAKSPLALLIWPAAFFLLYGVLFLAYLAAYSLYHSTDSLDWLAFVVWVVFASIVGRFVNLNYISIHRYYRDRLMETFLPDVERLTGQFTEEHNGVNPADYTKLSRMCQETAVGPYHIINSNIVLVESENKKFRARGGDNFVLSPFYCGSGATGWRATNEFMNNNMTLATAMSISGAAANPDTGVGGEGPTRNPVLSLLMTLLNVRLGYWAPNPNPNINRWQNERSKKEALNPLHGYRPNFLVPTLTSIALGKVIGSLLSKLSRGAISQRNFGKNERNRLVELTDGGHFENLGLYELIRRKVDIIIVCDGAADSDFTFGDLGNAVEKARVDFGAIIRLDTTPLIPVYGNSVRQAIHYAESGYAIGNIEYADRTTGKLVYIKTTLISGMPSDLVSYKKAHSTFPDQTTADQFFDEKQFEAYRELGFILAGQMTEALELKDDGSLDYKVQVPEGE